MCIFICTKQRTTSLVLFVNQQLCYSRQNKNFSIKLYSLLGIQDAYNVWYTSNLPLQSVEMRICRRNFQIDWRELKARQHPNEILWIWQMTFFELKWINHLGAEPCASLSQLHNIYATTIQYFIDSWNQ